MNQDDLQKLIDDIKIELTTRSNSLFAIIGNTPTAYCIVKFFSDIQQLHRVTGIYDVGFLKIEENSECPPRKPIGELTHALHTAVIIASDQDKERLIRDSLPFLLADTTILISGYAHFRFSDTIFDAVTRNPLVPSLANGYPNTLIHIFQCLKNAAQLNLNGVVVEFGMFKGGTTMLISQFIEKLSRDWKVFGFDTFSGFPPKRSPLDMYRHDGCVFTEEDTVRRFLSGRNVEIVTGDIVATVQRLRELDIILAFVDTDNFTPANAVLDVIQNWVLEGGAIVFDHFTGRDRFRYTLGERFAASRLLNDSRYFNLHDTGVFIRQHSSGKAA